MDSKTSRSIPWFAIPVITSLFLPVARAHHGSALSYDFSRTITLNAVVTTFAWINPHALLYVDAKDDRGNVAHWTCEFTSPGVLAGYDWYKTKLKPGDKIALTMHPAISGALVGQFNKIIFPDGSAFRASDIGARKTDRR